MAQMTVKLGNYGILPKPNYNLLPIGPNADTAPIQEQNNVKWVKSAQMWMLDATPYSLITSLSDFRYCGTIIAPFSMLGDNHEVLHMTHTYMEVLRDKGRPWSASLSEAQSAVPSGCGFYARVYLPPTPPLPDDVKEAIAPHTEETLHLWKTVELGWVSGTDIEVHADGLSVKPFLAADASNVDLLVLSLQPYANPPILTLGYRTKKPSGLTKYQQIWNSPIAQLGSSFPVFEVWLHYVATDCLMIQSNLLTEPQLVTVNNPPMGQGTSYNWGLLLDCFAAHTFMVGVPQYASEGTLVTEWTRSPVEEDIEASTVVTSNPVAGDECSVSKQVETQGTYPELYWRLKLTFTPASKEIKGKAIPYATPALCSSQLKSPLEMPTPPNWNMEIQDHIRSISIRRELNSQVTTTQIVATAPTKKELIEIYPGVWQEVYTNPIYQALHGRPLLPVEVDYNALPLQRAVIKSVREELHKSNPPVYTFNIECVDLMGLLEAIPLLQKLDFRGMYFIDALLMTLAAAGIPESRVIYQPQGNEQRLPLRVDIEALQPEFGKPIADVIRELHKLCYGQSQLYGFDGRGYFYSVPMPDRLSQPKRVFYYNHEDAIKASSPYYVRFPYTEEASWGPQNYANQVWVFKRGRAAVATDWNSITNPQYPYYTGILIPALVIIGDGFITDAEQDMFCDMLFSRLSHFEHTVSFSSAADPYLAPGDIIALNFGEGIQYNYRLTSIEYVMDRSSSPGAADGAFEMIGHYQIVYAWW